MDSRHTSVLIDPLAADTATAIANAALSKADGALARGETALFYSSVEPATVAAIQSRLGLIQSAVLVEETFAELAKALVAQGARRLVVAGGETSG